MFLLQYKTVTNLSQSLTSILSLEVLFSSLFRSSSSCSNSLMLSSNTLGQKSPSKYGSSFALVRRSSVACLKNVLGEEKHAIVSKGLQIEDTLLSTTSQTREKTIVQYADSSLKLFLLSLRSTAVTVPCSRV